MIAGSNSEETIFAHALGIDSAAEREAYLREACTARLERVQGSLRAHDRAGGFLQHHDAGARGVPPSG